MKEHQVADWSVLHTAEEMQRLSNLGHRIEGILLIMVAILAIGEATGILKVKLLWPSVIVIAGIFLLAFLLLHHGFDKFKLVWNLILSDGQQRQHLIMATLLITAGVTEITYRTTGYSTFKFGWPLVICTIGIMFLIHEQHGSSDAVEWAQKIHKYLGILMIVVAIFILLSLMLGTKYRWLLYSWPIL
ncbi:MAG: hypothetical protein C0490_17475, partial [Marivirga sp.]|nr:hypothetical protein [Marivirga sp.]